MPHAKLIYRYYLLRTIRHGRRTDQYLYGGFRTRRRAEHAALGIVAKERRAVAREDWDTVRLLTDTRGDPYVITALTRRPGPTL